MRTLVLLSLLLASIPVTAQCPPVGTPQTSVSQGAPTATGPGGNHVVNGPVGITSPCVIPGSPPASVTNAFGITYVDLPPSEILVADLTSGVATYFDLALTTPVVCIPTPMGPNGTITGVAWNQNDFHLYWYEACFGVLVETSIDGVPLATNPMASPGGGNIGGLTIDIASNTLWGVDIDNDTYYEFDLNGQPTGASFLNPSIGANGAFGNGIAYDSQNGTFLVSSAVYRHSMQEHGGAIVNMLADIWTGYPGMAHMAAARAGIENLTLTLSYEWARAGVRVNCVAPGTILSDGLLTYPPEVQERGAAGAADSPAGRHGTESEVSAAIAFLLSPDAIIIRGQAINIDAGETPY